MGEEHFLNPITHKNGFNFMKPMLVSWVSDLVSIKTYVEIGIYRMGTFEYMNSKLPIDVGMVGFDLFGVAPENEKAPEEMGLEYDLVLQMVSDWEREVLLVKGDTKKTLSKELLNNLEPPVLVYLDGGHSYDTVKSDFWRLYNHLSSGVIIMDDWIDPNVLDKRFVIKYGFKYDYSDGQVFMFKDGTWKLARELHDNPNISVSYIGDLFEKENELEFMGIVVI